MEKNVLHAILSAAICPGLGQIAKGEVLKGIVILLGLLLLLFVAVIAAFLFSVRWGIFLLLCALALYVWSIYDAYGLKSN